jgi:hypothetical protein
MKVYLVSTGEYSDYTILGLFSTREKADAFITELAKGRFQQPNDVEEYDLDARVGQAYGPTWLARITLDTGEVRASKCIFDSVRHPEVCTVEPHDNELLTAVSPISKEHATKVAVEKRQEWLRTRELGPTAG